MVFRYRVSREACGNRIIPRILQSSPKFPPTGLSLSYPTARKLATTALPPPSDAQTRAIKILRASRANILVNACPGSGKTTTILHMAAALPHQGFLVMVYNHRLMMETNERIARLGLKNAVVYNYHTLGHRFYSPECDTDRGLKRIVRDKLPVMRGKKLPSCDVLVLDEQQDMTPLLKTFIDRVNRDIEDMKNSKRIRPGRVRVVLFGDPRQELYGFKDADARFLTLAPLKELFGDGEEFELIKQNESYRLTGPIADFVNGQMLKPVPGEEIGSVKYRAPDGSAFPKPRYVFYKSLKWDRIVHYEPFKEVQRLLDKMDHSDVLVLAPSLRDRHVIDLANCLALKGHPVHVPDSEDSTSVSLFQSRGKITICTYHQSKGIEREAAVLYGFDESYHLYYNKTPENLQVAENPQYVAATRAKTDLVILNHCEYKHLPFLDPETLGDTCEIVNAKIYSAGTMANDTTEIPEFAVTTLTRNIHDRDMSACIEELELEQISPAFQESSPPSEIGTDGQLVESVAVITGAAAPAMYEYYTGRKRATCRLGSFAKLFQCFGAYNNGVRGAGRGLFRRIQADRPEINLRLRIVKQRMAAWKLSDGDILFLVNFSGAIRSGLLVKLLSIPLDCYSWVEPQHRKNIVGILSRHIPPDCQFEQGIHHTFSGTRSNGGIGIGGAFTVYGTVDISDLKNKCVWEVKYAQKLRVEDKLQAALYAGLVEATHGKGSTCRLINAMSGEVVEIKPKAENSYENIIRRLVNAKINKSATLSDLTDEEFKKEAGDGFENYIGPVVLPSWFNDQNIRRSRKSTIVGGAAGSSTEGTSGGAADAAEKAV
ncbi:P-loop containing nucleoside triphosphate hydrolase protein [Tuber magnatum]|uniref:P-loop containing nucleoside triphosphate hydrolase protein n=1 Tax=Tuber magnatum TaxID=42249 RepID=A0A317SV36_9PEZI|nr:P-loop containing nucleoside triphosphate hydrolase protein [Tuber magnatum]